MTPAPAALHVRGLTVRHAPGAVPALDAVSLEVAAGERVALLGLNGSGKTTLLLACAGLVPFDGEAAVCGIRVAPTTLREARRQLGVVFNVPEDQLLFPTVLEDVAFTLRQRGVPPAEALGTARETLVALGLAALADTPVHHLSHGQKQRVALAGALVARPPLLLLDEPSSGLDPPGRERLAALLTALPAAMVLATHDLAFARAVCERFVLLDGGRAVLDAASCDAVEARWRGGDPGASATGGAR